MPFTPDPKTTGFKPDPIKKPIAPVDYEQKAAEAYKKGGTSELLKQFRAPSMSESILGKPIAERFSRGRELGLEAIDEYKKGNIGLLSRELRKGSAGLQMLSSPILGTLDLVWPKPISEYDELVGKPQGLGVEYLKKETTRELSKQFEKLDPETQKNIKATGYGLGSLGVLLPMFLSGKGPKITPKEKINIIKNESIAPKELTPLAENSVKTILQSKYDPSELITQSETLFNILGKNKEVKPTFDALKKLIQEEKSTNPLTVKTIIEPYKTVKASSDYMKPVRDLITEIEKEPQLASVVDKKTGLIKESPALTKLKDSLKIEEDWYRKNQPTIGDAQIRKQALYRNFKKVFEGDVSIKDAMKARIDATAQGLKGAVENGIQDPIARQKLIDLNRQYGDLVDLEDLLKRQSENVKKIPPKTTVQKFPGYKAATGIINRVLGAKGIPISLQAAESAATVQDILPRLLNTIKKEYKKANVKPSSLGTAGAVGTPNIIDLTKKTIGAQGTPSILDIVRKASNAINLR